MVLRGDNKNKAVRRAVDIIRAFNDVAVELGLEKLADQGLIAENDRSGGRHMSSEPVTGKPRGKREWFTLAGDDSLVGYLARQEPTLSIKISDDD